MDATGLPLPLPVQGQAELPAHQDRDHNAGSRSTSPSADTADTADTVESLTPYQRWLRAASDAAVNEVSEALHAGSKGILVDDVSRKIA